MIVAVGGMSDTLCVVELSNKVHKYGANSTTIQPSATGALKKLGTMRYILKGSTASTKEGVERSRP